MSGIHILIGDSHGVYIPQFFTQKYDRADWGQISDWAWETCALGPDHENSQHYWEAWTEIADSASHTDSNGNVWHLYQEGDLFSYCEELMSEEEYENFFGEQRWVA